MSSKYCDKSKRCKFFGWCADDFDPQDGCDFFEPITNGEKIRAMTDEELAELFVHEEPMYGRSCFECPVDRPCDLEAECKDCFIEWLKKEVPE